MYVLLNTENWEVPMKTTYRSKTADAVLASLNDHSDLVAQRDDLLAACEAAVTLIDHGQEFSTPEGQVIKALRGAIARAKGE